MSAKWQAETLPVIDAFYASGRSQKFLDYSLVLALIYLSGSVFFISFHYQTAVLSMTAVTGALLVRHWLAGASQFSTRSTVQLLAYASLLALTVLLNSDANLGSHAAVYLQLVIAAGVAEIIPPRRFAFAASQLLSYLAMISLLFFIAGLTYPPFVQLFPHTPAIESTDYYNALIHVYTSSVGYGDLHLTTRNSGIFWEPGAYQAFLNVGLFWLLDDPYASQSSTKKRTLQALALIAAIVTTFSAMGYLLLCLVLFSRRAAVRNLISHKVVLVISALLVAGWAIARPAVTFDVAFLKYIADPSSVSTRLSLDQMEQSGYGWVDILFGMSLTPGGQALGTVWNSIVHAILTLGLLFTLLLLINYVRGAAAITRQHWALFLIVTLAFSTESLLWRPFFLYIAFAHASQSPVQQTQHDPAGRKPKGMTFPGVSS